jgi:hypothetical protein
MAVAITISLGYLPLPGVLSGGGTMPDVDVTLGPIVVRTAAIAGRASAVSHRCRGGNRIAGTTRRSAARTGTAVRSAATDSTRSRPIAQLKDLAEELKSHGVPTDAEFDPQKAKILKT